MTGQDAPGQRGVSAVASRRRPMSLGKQAVVAGIVGGAIISVAVLRGGAGPSDKKQDQAPTVIGQSTPPALAIYAQDPPAAPPPPQRAQPEPRQINAPQQTPEPRNVAGVVTGTTPKAPQWMVSYGSRMVRAAGGGESGQQTAHAAADSGSGGRTSVDFKPTSLPGQKAGRAIDLTFMLMPQPLHCTLDTAIDTTQPGPVFCHLPAPALSPKGTVLMEAGTQVIAEYKQMQRGQDRVFALAGTAWTPNGVPVPLQAPISDGLGRAGVPGVVDNHVFDRFGGALLLMSANSAFGVLQNLTQRSNNNNNINLNTGQAESIVGDVLRSTINIPPTLTKAQGEDIVIMTVVPIDFSDVYGLESRR